MRAQQIYFVSSPLSQIRALSCNLEKENGSPAHLDTVCGMCISEKTHVKLTPLYGVHSLELLALRSIP